MADATDLKSVTYKVYRFDPGLEDSFSIQSSVFSRQSAVFSLQPGMGKSLQSTVFSRQPGMGKSLQSTVFSLQPGDALFHKSYKSYKSYKIPEKCALRTPYPIPGGG